MKTQKLLRLLVALFLFFQGTHAFHRPKGKAAMVEEEKNEVIGIGQDATAVLEAIQHQDVRTVVTNRLTHLFFTVLVGFATDPFVEAFFNVTHMIKEGDSFRGTLTYGAANSISNGAIAWGITLLVDIVKDFFRIRLPFDADLVVAAPQIGFTVWLCRTISTFKHMFFKQAVANPERLGRVGLYDRLIDFLLGIGSVANILNILSVDVGYGLRSIFAMSGVSALVFTMGSKSIVEQLVAGFIVEAWDAIEVGQIVTLGDGTTGKVKRIGLLETEIVKFDNTPVRIPNSQLTVQRVSNLHYIKMAQVKQILRFKYSDLDKIPKVLEDIKTEIKKNCPLLISDGSKSFYALITQYQPDHVEAVLNCHFWENPVHDSFTEVKQEVLLSVAKAMKDNGVEFAIPQIQFQTEDIAAAIPVAAK